MVAQVLLVIDRCDHLSTNEHAGKFAELLSMLLRRAPRVKLLLTCRKNIDIPEEVCAARRLLHCLMNTR